MFPTSMKSNIAFARFLLFCLLLFSLTACGLLPQGAQSPGSKETEISLAVQATSLAEKEAMLIAQQTQVQAAAQAQPPTQPPVPTDPPAPTIPPTDVPADTPIPVEPSPTQPPIEETPTADVGEGGIVLDDWKMNKFLVMKADQCYNALLICWGAESTPPLSLSSTQPVLIDANWPNPYLVFYQKFNFKEAWNGTAAGYINAQVNGRWKLLKAYESVSAEWYLEKISLKDFSGSEIIIGFYSELSGTKWGSPKWYIQDVRIFPDYVP